MQPDYYDTEELAGLLKEIAIGTRITKMTNEEIHLDNGKVIEIETNEGCGGCSSGWSEIEIINHPKTEAAVMNIELEETGCETYRIFIYYVDGSQSEIATDDGYGNGCYGGGFWVTVK